MIPNEFKNFYSGRNILFFPEYEFVFKLSFPQVFVKYKVTEGYYTDFEKFFKNIAEVQYLDGKKPSDNEHQKILNDIWNFITMINSTKNDTYISND